MKSLAGFNSFECFLTFQGIIPPMPTPTTVRQSRQLFQGTLQANFGDDRPSQQKIRKFHQHFGKVVEHLDDLEHVCSMLDRVGRCHAHVAGGQISSGLDNK